MRSLPGVGLWSLSAISLWELDSASDPWAHYGCRLSDDFVSVNPGSAFATEIRLTIGGATPFLRLWSSDDGQPGNPSLTGWPPLNGSLR
jgi:hypothetical protein